MNRDYYGPGVGELFHRHAAPEAIAARLKRTKAERDRYARWVERLEQLHAQRVAEKERGDWPHHVCVDTFFCGHDTSAAMPGTTSASEEPNHG